jgi:ribosomal protein S27E
MKYTLLFIIGFSILNLSPNLFSQSEVSESHKKTSIKCSVCGYENPNEQIHCEACGGLLKEKEELEEMGIKIHEVTVKLESKKYIKFKGYIPVEKEVFVSDTYDLPMPYGIGGSIGFEKVNRFGISWEINLGYYRVWNRMFLLFCHSDSILICKLKYGYEGFRGNFTYKWADENHPFWTAVGIPILIGKCFAETEFGDKAEISGFGIGGELSGGVSIFRESNFSLEPGVRIQLIPVFYKREDTPYKTFLLSLQMELGVNVKI